MSTQVGQPENLLPAEDLEDALAHLARVEAVGGWKQLAVYIRPALEDDPVEAGRWLRRALNPERREAFQQKHFRRALKLDKAVGCGVLWDWHCRDIGYETSKPRESKSRRLMLMQEDEYLTKRRRQIQEELEELEKSESVAELRRIKK